MAESEELVALPPSGDTHGKPEDGMECLATMEDITEEDGNYCEYQSVPSKRWQACKFSAETVRNLLKRQFNDYVTAVRKADCEADLKRRLGKGPPIWLEDKHALPLPEDDTHVERVWFASDNTEYSAKLCGALEGEAHQKLWDELSVFLVPAEAKEEKSSAEETATEAETTAPAVANLALAD